MTIITDKNSVVWTRLNLPKAHMKTSNTWKTCMQHRASLLFCIIWQTTSCPVQFHSHSVGFPRMRSWKFAGVSLVIECSCHSRTLNNHTVCERKDSKNRTDNNVLLLCDRGNMMLLYVNSVQSACQNVLLQINKKEKKTSLYRD